MEDPHDGDSRGPAEASAFPRRISTAPAAPSTSSAPGAGTNVRVVARIRPLSPREAGGGGGGPDGGNNTAISAPTLTSVLVSGGGGGGGDRDGRTFEFDAVFPPGSTQEEVYGRSCGDMVGRSIYRGFNATILAYGQTGSGKTYTMGTDGDGDGIIARAVRDLFLHKSRLKNGDDRVKITMSYLEIYNERAVDLLAEADGHDDEGSGAAQQLQVRDSAEGVVVQNLRHFEVGGPSEVRALMERASGRRATGSTNMNAVSSRSHAICTLNVTVGPDVSGGEEEGADTEGKRNSTGSAGSAGSNDGGPGAAIRAKLTLVDLAGSERAKRTGAEGARLREGININKGLFVLGQVVSALSELGQGGASPRSSSSAVSHIPYRDSKLTRLLQDSLGGNSRTVMIACVSPATANAEESVNTLRYAERTRNIKNLAVRNVVSSSGCSAAEAAALRRENARLRSDVARLEGRLAAGGGPVGSFGTMAMPSGGSGTLSGDAQLHALLAENEALRESSSRHAREMLEASVRADRWQARAEAVVDEARSRGVELSGTAGDGEDEAGGIAARLRGELEGCRAELREARTESAVARAVSGAVLSSGGNGDDLAPSDVVAAAAEAEEDGGDGTSERITSELSAVSATIEQKEAIVAAMARERACRDGLQQHFEASLRGLQQEVDGLTAERDALEARIAASAADHARAQQPSQRRKRGAAAASDPVARRLKEQVAQLERRISDLKSKAAQHRSAIKMKDEAERKCVRLMAEIADDKRRRADLQRKLKEASQERREERNAAKKDAARMMKDSSRLKIELQKMRSAASKQAAVLKRKIDQAAARERQRKELERKRRSAGRMRMASSSSAEPSGDVGEGRRAELREWIDRELEHGSIRTEIDEQRRQLDSAVGDRRRLLRGAGGTEEKPPAECAEELGQIERTITSLRTTVQDLESAAARAFPPPPSSSTAGPPPSSSSAFRFLQTDVFRGLSKADAKFVLGYLYDACAEGRRDLASLVDRQEVDVKLRVDSALVKEREGFDRELVRAKMEHAEVTLNLLESTSDAVNSKVGANAADSDAKEEVDRVLGSYLTSWSAATDAIKSDLEDVKDTQDGLVNMLENVANGIAFKPKKKAKKQPEEERGYDSEAFESEESFLEEDDGNDSEYEPTPKASKANKAKGKKAREEKKAATAVASAAASPQSPIGESYIDDIDTKKVNSLKRACKRLGVPCTGKKEVLKNRVRDTILNSSTAVLQPDETQGDLDPFGSALKKVNFDDIPLDPEFQPVPSDGKRLFDRDDALGGPPSKPPKTPKRKRIADGEENNGAEEAPASKKCRQPLAFMSSSPRPTSAAEKSRTPIHQKQTAASSNKRLIPDAKQSTAITKRPAITSSVKKHRKRGMNAAVMMALKSNDAHLNDSM